MNNKKLTYIVIAFWIFITLFGIIKNEFIIRNGREILLETVPVDPRDMLMGDYVILNYKIAQLPRNYKDFDYNENVYVSLSLNRDNIASVKKIGSYKPDNEIFLKGKITGCNTTIPFYKTGKCISYGIESYYVKENTGMALENELANGALVKISLLPTGETKVIGFK